MNVRITALASIVCAGAIVAAQAQVTKESVPGIVNFAKVETTVACAGATTPAALAEVKRMGYASVINLRQASEPGAEIEASAAAAKAAGLNYIHIPFNTASPDAAVVDTFIKAVTDKANQPAFIHCASANRAAALWMVKRIAVDKWDVERASTEATALGLTSPALKAFAIEQAQKR
ncbi:MAG TPA: sulfur transferase domain-containing protein [Vicinamibacterales bacterium]|nr:sulfur transferase domain-containing protein [Vicinamibacterales bacterium]